MKKFLMFFILQFLVVIPSFADSFPILPLSVFGTIKDIKGVNISSGAIISFYDGQSNLLSNYTTKIDGQYGGTTAFEEAIILNQFNGGLIIKVQYLGNTYTITSSEIDDSGNSGGSCPSKSSITFFSGVCKYNLNIKTNVLLTGGSTTHTGGTIVSTGTTSSGSNINLGGTNIIINSFSGDTNYLTGTLTLSGVNSIIVSSGSWNGILIPPTLIPSGSGESATQSELAGLFSQNTTNTIIQTVKVGGESGISLIASGSNFKVSFVVPSYAPGTVLKLYRSTNGNIWEINSPDATCTLDSNRLCTFYSNHLSFFSSVLSTTTTTTGGSTTGGSSVGGSTSVSVISQCLDKDLICKAVGLSKTNFRLYSKTGVSCQGGNLGKTCDINKQNDTVLTGSIDKVTDTNKGSIKKTILKVIGKKVNMSKDDKFSKLLTVLLKGDEVEFIKVVKGDLVLVKITKTSKSSSIGMTGYVKISKTSFIIIKSELNITKTNKNVKVLQVIGKSITLSKDEKYTKLLTVLLKGDEVEFIKVIKGDIVLVKIIKSSKTSKVGLEGYVKLKNNLLKYKK